MKLKINIYRKMLLYFLGTTLLVYVASLGYISYKIKLISSETSRNLLQTHSDKVGVSVKGVLEKNIIAVNAIANAYQKYESFDEPVRRERLTSLLKSEIESDEKFLSVWSVWEPNSVDQLDDKCILQPTSTIIGNFAPAYYRKGGQVQMEVNPGMPPYQKDFYTIPKEKQKTVILEPYYYSYAQSKTDSSLITSAIAPIIANGEFKGVVGIDFSLESFQDTLSKIKPFGDGVIYLISAEGNFVYHPEYKLINKPFNDYAGQIIEGFNYDQLSHLNEKSIIYGFDPYLKKESVFASQKVAIGHAGQSWTIIISVPNSTIYYDANKAFTKTLGTGLIGLLILSFIVSMIAETISRPLINISKQLAQLSKGIIGQQGNVHSKFNDEISDLGRSMDKLLAGLQSTIQFAGEIGEGKLDAKYTLLSQDDILGNSLISMQNSLIHAKDEKEKKKIIDDQRNWVTHGLAKFGEIIRQENDNIESFSMNILQNLLEYTHIAQGAFYIRLESDFEQNTNKFEAKAAIAYGKAVMLEMAVDREDGLFNRVINESRSILIENLPENYVFFTEGMKHKEKPRNLLIVPMIVNNSIYGIIELLSYNKFETYQIEFIEKLCENVASVVSSVNININTARLLDQSRMQADELTQHEEEMRQNLEEMQATQEEAAKRQNSLNSYIKAVYLGMMVAEIDLKGRILDMSPSMAAFYGINTENMKGKFYNAYMAQDDQTREEFNQFWENLLQHGEGKRKQKFNIRNKEVWTIEYYRVVLEDTRPTKVIIIAIDKTKEKELNERLKAEIESHIAEEQ